MEQQNDGRNPPPAAARGGNRNTAPQYTEDEITYLLGNIAAILPVDGADWEAVKDAHGEFYGANDRATESIKRKFQQLYRVQKPTGDPTCPPNVRLAKQIRRQIIDKCEIDDADGDDAGVRVLDMEDLQDFNIDDEGIPPAAFPQPPRAIVQRARAVNNQPAPNNQPAASNQPRAPNNQPAANNQPRAPNNQPAANNQPRTPNGVLSPIPANISSIARSRKNLQGTSKKGDTDDIFELYKLKMLQREEDRDADREALKREREDKASRAEDELKRLRMEQDLRREEEERRYQREQEARREDNRAFRELMLMMMFGNANQHVNGDAQYINRNA